MTETGLRSHEPEFPWQNRACPMLPGSTEQDVRPLLGKFCPVAPRMGHPGSRPPFGSMTGFSAFSSNDQTRTRVPKQISRESRKRPFVIAFLR